jgi:hypothetical protein
VKAAAHRACGAERLVLVLLALSLLGCGRSFRAARFTEPVSMAPLADATVSVQAGRALVTEEVFTSGVGDGTALAVEIGVTNAGREPYTLSAASFSCRMDLSADSPNETLSLTPAGGGEGSFPDGLAPDDMQLGSTTLAPGGSARYWVVFRGYRFRGSEAPRKITVSLPDQRGRRIELVIADPARGSLRWEVNPASSGWTYGVQNMALVAPGLTAMGMGAQIARVARAGPIVWDVGLSSRMVVQSQGRLTTSMSTPAPTTFTNIGVNAHVAWPLVRWGGWLDPRSFGIYAGGEAGLLIAVEKPPPEGEMPDPPSTYGALAVEGGVELDIGAVRAAATPFPVSFATPPLFRWSVRAGYTHWFVDGLNSAGYVTSLRLAW